MASLPTTVPTLPPVPVAEPSSLSEVFDIAKKYPTATSLGLGVAGAALIGQEEEPEQQLAYEEPVERKPVKLEGGEQVAALTPEKYEQLYTQGGGTQEQITSLQSPFRYVPKTTYASHGGLIGLAEGGAVELVRGKQRAKPLTTEEILGIYTQGGGKQKDITSLQSPYGYVRREEPQQEPQQPTYSGGAVQRFLDNGGDSESAPSISTPSKSTTSAEYSGQKGIDPVTGAYTDITTSDKVRNALSVAGLFSPVAAAASTAMSLSNAFSNINNPNVAISSAPVAGQVSSGLFNDPSLQIDAMRNDVAMDAYGPDDGRAAADMSPDKGQSPGAGFDYSLEGNTDVDISGEEDGAEESYTDVDDGAEDDPLKTGGLIGLADGGMVTVQPGDTLTKIADETGMTVEGLQSLNNITNPDIIQAGQQLKISEGDSGLDIASIKENIKDFVSKLSDLPEKVRSGIMSLVPESFNKPEVEDTTDSKQVEQSEYPRPPEMPSTISDIRAVYIPKTYKKLLNRGITFKEILDLIEGEHVKGNPLTEVSPEGATGLFQFMPKTAKDVKTSTDAILKMTAEEQVDVYDRYLTKFGWKKGIPLGFMQAAPGKAKKFLSMKDSDIIYSKNSKKAKANPQWRDSKGNVTKGSVLKHYNSPVMKAKGGNIGHYFQGQVDGAGDGQSDNVPFKVDARSKSDPSGAVLSVDEYVLPADVVSMMGNGSSNAGASKLDNFVKSVRKESFGTTKQQKPYNTERGLSALV